MKQLILMFIIALSAVVTQAQPHTWLVYGSGSLSQNSNSNSYYSGSSSNSTSWSIAPGIGYQFNKHLTVGVQGNYSHIDGGYYPYPVAMPYNNYYYNYNASATINWSAGAFFRYTQTVGHIFFLYGQANASYTSTEGNNIPGYYLSNGSYVYTYLNGPSATGLQINLFPAIGAKVYKGLALNFSVGGINYVTTSQNADYYGSNKSSSISINFGQQVNFGISDNFSCHMMHHRKHHHAVGSEYRQPESAKDEDEDDAPKEGKKHHKHQKHKNRDDE